MVALLHPAQLQPAAAPVARPSAARPRHLRLVETKTKSTVDPMSVMAVAAVMATVLLVVLVRGVQGAPPAADWQGLTETSGVVATAGVSADAVTVTVLEGDSWNSIAARVAPGVDAVAFARLVASENEGYALYAGQVLTIPSAG